MILVLGGTYDSLEVCRELNKIFHLKYALSVPNEDVNSLAKGRAKKIILGEMSKEDMKKFIKENKVKQIIDATHPYKAEVSKNAIECSSEFDIEYIRYEQKSLIENLNHKNIFVVDNIEEACTIASQRGYNIFIGSDNKDLDKYIELIPNKNLITRILPTSDGIKNCEDLGLNTDNIIAMKGPFSKSINIEIYKQYKIDLVITKESGLSGGFLEKVDAAEALDIPVVIIKRKSMDYPRVINEARSIRDLIKI